MRLLFSLTVAFAWATSVHAWSIYVPKNQVVYGGSATTYTVAPTGLAAFLNHAAPAENDTTTLTPPPVPNPAIPTVVPVQLSSTGGVPGLSIQHKGNFFGFSIEMSVANQVCESS